PGMKTSTTTSGRFFSSSARPTSSSGRAEDELADEEPDRLPLERRHRFREPVALGVVAEEVVEGRHAVALEARRALVVDVEPAVARGALGPIDEAAEADDELVGRVHDAVDEIEVAGGATGAQLGIEAREILEDAIGQLDERLGRHELEDELGEDAERAVRAGAHGEQVGVAVASDADHLAGAGHELVLVAGVVEAAVPEGHGLHRAAGDRAAERDALELGHDRGHEPALERGGDELRE